MEITQYSDEEKEIQEMINKITWFGNETWTQKQMDSLKKHPTQLINYAQQNTYDDNSVGVGLKMMFFNILKLLKHEYELDSILLAMIKESPSLLEYREIYPSNYCC